MSLHDLMVFHHVHGTGCPAGESTINNVIHIDFFGFA
ncbi:MAG: hypothetical protein ACI97A_003693 [Planctomycetota bacterium]|jgi:hypothetical protein